MKFNLTVRPEETNIWNYVQLCDADNFQDNPLIQAMGDRHPMV